MKKGPLVNKENCRQENMMLHEAIKTFRQTFYDLSGKRKDVIMNLLDALSGYGHQYSSVVQLSLAECFKRQYSSITEAITIGAADFDWVKIQQLIYDTVIHDNGTNIFLLDVTHYPRPFSATLADKSIVHAPNPAPGNNPICVGHQYSTLAMLPQDKATRQQHWLVPIDVSRVPSTKKGNEFGMEQLTTTIDQLNLGKAFSISVGDSLYGTENCRVEASQHEHLVHIFRLNSKRNRYRAATEDEEQQTGRKKIFSHKMALNKPKTHLEPTDHVEFDLMNASGKTHHVVIDDWSDMIVRGSKTYQATDHPIRLIRVQLFDASNSPVFKRPLWIGVSGKARDQIALPDIYEYYRCRYDIEHYFRFNKHKLMMSGYQTPDAEHEALWCKLCLLAYMQLYLAKQSVKHVPRPWEKYLPEFKETQQKSVATPSQTQRDFARLLTAIGTPASPCKPRGRNAGREYGNVQAKRTPQSVQFKKKKSYQHQANQVNSKSENNAAKSNPEKLNDLLDLVKGSLKKLDCLPQDFAKLLL